jgi:uncharacterized protein
MNSCVKFLCLLLLSTPTFANQLVIIIDDLGNVQHLGQRAIELPGNITFAVMPERPFSTSLAQSAVDAGKDVIIHMPMANHSNFPLGNLGLDVTLSDEDITENLKKAFISVPQAIGLNNHLGSKFTEYDAGMHTVLSYLKANDKFFIDSVTTPYSAATKQAKAVGITFDKRDVFLDHEQTREFIDQQFKLALKVVEKSGSAIIIGHPYPQTLEYLEEVLPLLNSINVKTVSISEYLKTR